MLLLRLLVWLGVALAGAWAIAVLAVFHGETVNAVWFIVAAAAVYALAYRFYGAFLAARLFALDRHRPSDSTTDATSCRPTAGSSSAITSPRSPAPVR